ncbi:MAG TPA: hypothetical protein PK867_24185 [Pirellulales bacterium]|nr:hypothetical protein [Pirellulales bacterium]
MLSWGLLAVFASLSIFATTRLPDWVRMWLMTLPGKLQWRVDLSKLPPLSRPLIRVHGGYIVLTIAAMGLVSLCEAAQLADGSSLARTICGFVAVFWSVRLAIQLMLFDGRIYLTSPFLKIGYHSLTAAFTILALVYGWLALGSG